MATKAKIFYAPKAYNKRKINIWHTTKFGRKIRKLFKPRAKFFSTEVNRRLSRKLFRFSFKPLNLGLSGKRLITHFFSLGSTERSVKAWQPLLFNTYWLFYVPMVIPGAIRLRRFKALFRGRHHANRNTNVWFGGLSIKQLSQVYSFYASKEKLCFSLGSEQLLPMVFLKLGFFKTTKAARNFVKNKSPKALKLSMVEPGMLVTVDHPSWASLHYSFLKNMVYKV